MTSFGSTLRRERELRGISLQEIAVATKIGINFLEAIEADRFDKLPQGAFVRGFVREYARHLALDEQKVLTELSFQVKATAPAPAVPAGTGRYHERTNVIGDLANAGAALGFVALVGFLIFSPTLSRRTAQPALPPVDGAPTPPVIAQATPPPSQVLASTSGSVVPQPLQLTLTATEDCWIGLDVGGDRVENRVLKKGESYQITARQNASLAVGNAGGLLIAIDSGPPRPLGNRGEVKRNIQLSPEALSALSSVPAEPEATPTKPIG